LNYGLVEWKVKTPCLNVIPMSDFVDLEIDDEYIIDSEYKVRFIDSKSRRWKIFPAILKLKGTSIFLSLSC
jgi:hypothetical protein